MIAEKWVNDIPSQFQESTNILAIIGALSTQLDEVEQVSNDLIEKTDIDTAVGRQLDMLGTIVNISRQDAYKLVELTSAEILDDTTYRNVLRFQALKNNSPGTYADIMKGLYLLWGDLGADISYRENEVITFGGEDINEPAEIGITVADIPSDAMDPMMIKPMVIKPGGVRINFTSSFLDKLEIGKWERFTNLQVTLENNHYYDASYKYNKAIRYMADGLSYHEYDGAYRYNAQIKYGGEEVEDIDTVDAVILNQAKRKLLTYRAYGTGDLQITQIAFGDGTISGRKYTPNPDATALVHEVARNNIGSVQEVGDNYRYIGALGTDQCNGLYITEMALVDSDNQLVCIKTFDKKYKPAGVELTFKIDDILDLS